MGLFTKNVFNIDLGDSVKSIPAPKDISSKTQSAIERISREEIDRIYRKIDYSARYGDKETELVMLDNVDVRNIVKSVFKAHGYKSYDRHYVGGWSYAGTVFCWK